MDCCDPGGGHETFVTDAIMAFELTVCELPWTKVVKTSRSVIQKCFYLSSSSILKLLPVNP